MINTNYNTPSKTSFTARLDLHSARGMILNDDVKILKNIASKIGKPTDAIEVKIGKNRWSKGCNSAEEDFSEGYPMKVITVINGNEKKFNLDEPASCCSSRLPHKPFKKLESFFKKLERVTNPDFRQGVLSKIESLKTEFSHVKWGKRLEADYETKKQAFDEIAVRRESIIAKKERLKKEIEKSQKKLEI